MTNKKYNNPLLHSAISSNVHNPEENNVFNPSHQHFKHNLISPPPLNIPDIISRSSFCKLIEQDSKDGLLVIQRNINDNLELVVKFFCGVKVQNFSNGDYEIKTRDEDDISTIVKKWTQQGSVLAYRNPINEHQVLFKFFTGKQITKYDLLNRKLVDEICHMKTVYACSTFEEREDNIRKKRNFFHDACNYTMVVDSKGKTRVMEGEC